MNTREKMQRMRVFRFVTVILMVVAVSNAAQAQSSSESILYPSPYEYNPIHPISSWFFESIVTIKTSSKIRWQKSLTALSSELASSKESRKNRILKKLVRQSLGMALSIKDSKKEMLKKGDRQKLLEFANKHLKQLRERSKNRRARADISIQIAYLDFLLVDNPFKIKSLTNIIKASSRKWSGRGRILQALIFLKAEDKYHSRGLAILKSEKLYNSKGEKGIVFSAAGVLLSGKNLFDEKVKSSDSKWKVFTANSLRLGRGSQYSSGILSWAHIALSGAEGNELSSGVKWIWSLKGYEELAVVSSVLERSALYHVENRNLLEASIAYSNLLNTQSKRGRVVDGLETKVARLNIGAYKLSNDTKSFNFGFSQLVKRIETQDRKISSDAKVAIRLYRENFIKQGISALADKENYKYKIQTAINIQRWYRKVRPYLAVKSQLGVAQVLGDLYGQIDKPRRAFAVWKSFLKYPEFSKIALSNAIKWQSKAATWPVEVDFALKTTANVKERSKLLKLYEKKSKSINKLSWADESQKGLLLIHLGQFEMARKLWMETLKKYSGNQSLGNQQAGLLASTLYSRKSWAKYIELGHVIEKRNISPQLNESPLNWRVGFAEALYNNGKSLFASKKYKSASPVLSEFVKEFQKDPRREEALFLLATSNNLENKRKIAIKYYLSLILTYPQGKYRYKSNLLAADAALKGKFGKEYAFLLEDFSKAFPNDAKINQVRLNLVDYYLSAGLYSDALQKLKVHSTHPKVSGEQQVLAALKYMDTEEKYGERNHTLFGANFVVNHPKSSLKQKALAYGLHARHAADRGDIKKLSDIDARLSAWNTDLEEVTDTLSFTRFTLSIRNAPLEYREISNITQTKPLNAVQKYVVLWQNKVAWYERSCINGRGSFCAPSSIRLWQLTNLAIKRIDKIRLPSTLAVAEVAAFEQKKSVFLKPMKRAAQNWLKRANYLTKKTKAPTEWKNFALESGQSTSTETPVKLVNRSDY